MKCSPESVGKGGFGTLHCNGEKKHDDLFEKIIRQDLSDSFDDNRVFFSMMTLRGEILGVEASVQQSVNHHYQRNTANGMGLFCQIEICAMKLTGSNPIDGRTHRNNMKLVNKFTERSHYSSGLPNEQQSTL